MKTFVSFFKENYMLYEDVMYTDRTLFKRIFSQEAQPTPQEQAKIQQQYANQQKKQNTDENDLQTIALIKKYKQNPTSKQGIDARNQVVEKYVNLVQALAWKQQRLGNIPEHISHEDLFQSGVLGLMHGIEKYDPDKGVPFFAYIKSWILAEIKNPFNMNRKQTIHGDNLSVNDSTSIDKTIGGGEGQYADKESTAGQILYDPNSIGDSPLDATDDEIQHAKLQEYLKRLPEKELTAIKLFLFDGKTYGDIGNIMHMSQPAAQWFVEKALTRLRQFAKEEGFSPEKTLPKISTLKGTAMNFAGELQ